MSQSVIIAHVVDQTIQLANLPLIASGSENVVQIRFDFCSLWDGYGKTAVLYKEETEVYHVPIVGNKATVPLELLTEKGHFYFGVMGVADNTRTTEVLKIAVVQGALTVATADPAEPTPSIYKQLLTAYGKMERELAVERARIDTLTATRSAGGVAEFPLDDDYFNGTIVSTGTDAHISLLIDGLSLVEYGQHQTDWYRMPLNIAPLAEVAVQCSTPDLEVTLTPGDFVDDVRLTRITIRNLTSTYVEHYNVACSAFYPLSSVAIAELEDARIGLSGWVYPSVGGAIRDQLRLAEAHADEKAGYMVAITLDTTSGAVAGDATYADLTSLLENKKRVTAWMGLTLNGVSHRALTATIYKDENSNVVFDFGKLGAALVDSLDAWSFVSGEGGYNPNPDTPVGPGDADPYAVQFIAQELAKNEQAQARENIGAQIRDLIITIDRDTMTASHSASEIKTHVDAGGAAVLRDGTRLACLHSADVASVTFCIAATGNTKTSQHLYTISDEKALSEEDVTPLLEVYPVGSIYMSIIANDPARLFGGTWERLKDRFLLGAGDTYEPGETGGEAEHTLTVEEMPSHTHKLGDIGSETSWGINYGNYVGTGTGYGLESNAAFVTKSTGGSQPHNNMPPYLTVYMWVRTA